MNLTVEELASLLADMGEVHAEPPGLAGRALRELQAVGVDDLDTLRSFRKADRQVGGGRLYTTVASYLQRNVAPRLFGHVPDADGQPVFAAAATLTEMAGWMAHDAGRDDLAEQHFRRALGMAQISRDAQLGAHICGSLAHLAHHRQQPHQAFDHAYQGLERFGAPANDPHLLALQARSYASARNHEACTERLRLAEEALARARTEARSPWVAGFDDAALAMESARCLRQLGHLRDASWYAEQVIVLRPPGRARSRGFAQLLLAGILVEEKRPDDACEVAQTALTSTRAVSSTLVVRQFEALARQLLPFRRSATVAVFLTAVRAELTDRRWLNQWLLPDQEPA